jgi:ribose-phosphate pyrophosphokinase
MSHQLNPSEVRFFSGSANPKLAKEIADYLSVPLAETSVRRFSNDNMYLQLGDSVRSRSVYILQSLSPPVNDHLMELLMMLDIARGAAAREIHAIIPYYSFARSDKKDSPRISVTARLVADLLKCSGATHVMTMMLHSPQVHGFFSVPIDHLSSRPAFEQYFLKRDLSNTLVVAGDMGNAKSAARFANTLKLPVAAGNKTRVTETEVRFTGLVGTQVKGFKRALLYDDEIATGGTIRELTMLLLDEGIEEVWVACTHGVFVRDSFESLAGIPQITEIVTTDTVPQAPHPKLTVLSVAPVIGEAIYRNATQQSIGDLFVYGDE